MLWFILKRNYYRFKKNGPGQFQTMGVFLVLGVFFTTRLSVQWTLQTLNSLWTKVPPVQWVLWTKLFTGKKSTTQLQYPCYRNINRSHSCYFVPFEILLFESVLSLAYIKWIWFCSQRNQSHLTENNINDFFLRNRKRINMTFIGIITTFIDTFRHAHRYAPTQLVNGRKG